MDNFLSDKNSTPQVLENESVGSTQSAQRIDPMNMHTKATDIGRAIKLDQTQSSDLKDIFEYDIPLNDLAALPRVSANAALSDINGNYVNVLDLCNAMSVSSSEFRRMLGEVNDTNAYIDVRVIKALPQMKLQYDLNSSENNEFSTLTQLSNEDSRSNTAVNNANPYRDLHTTQPDSNRFFTESKSIVSNSFIPSISNETVSNNVTESYSPVIITKKNSSDKPDPYDSVKKAKMRAYFFHFNEKLYVYINGCYERLTTREALGLINDICRDDVEAVGHPRHINAILDAIMLDNNFSLNKEKWNNTAVVFNNTVLNTQNMVTYDHSPNIITTFRLCCNYNQYDTDPQCNVFSTLLYRISGGSIELMKRIWQMFGYCLSPDDHAKIIFVLQGVHDSGKSLLTNILSMFFLEKQVTSMNIFDFEKNFSLAELEGKNICIVPDMPSNTLSGKTVNVLKAITGNDKVSSDVKYKDHIYFVNHAKIICATNHPIRMSECDEALIERLVVIPFKNSIPANERDPYLLEKIKLEMDSIAKIALQHYQELVRNNYRFAGSYAPMTVINKGNYNSNDYAYDVIEFLNDNYVLYQNNHIAGNEREDDKMNRNRSFVEDMHKLFCSMYYPISINAFSTFCKQYYENNPLVNKNRHRKIGETNAQNCFDGIILKDNSTPCEN